jgi:nicotinate-nucleotide adenylyltransferase
VARVGILGGTFNPPHIGHLLCASEAILALGLDKVLLMPVHTPPHKQVLGDPGPDVRLELCRLAVDGDERLSVSDLEVGRAGTSYTVDTLRALDEDSPEDDLTLIVGGDVAQGLPSWKEPEQVLRLASLAVAERQGVRRADVLERLAALTENGGRIEFFDMPRVDVSSSLIRRRAAGGLSIRYLVPDAVADEIARCGLYSDPGS